MNLPQSMKLLGAIAAIGLLTACEDPSEQLGNYDTDKPSKSSAEWLEDAQSLTLTGSISEDRSSAQLTNIIPQRSPARASEGMYVVVTETAEGVRNQYTFDVQERSNNGRKNFSVTMPVKDIYNLRVFMGPDELLAITQHQTPETDQDALDAIRVWRSDGRICFQWPADEFPQAGLAWRDSEQHRHLMFADAADSEACVSDTDVPADVQYVVTIRNQLFVRQALVK
ncbi:hypothetical protein FM042_05100 [Aliidiomarina halalkaliphila]|uniref:Uncharacterized protein n=1 Tax=Aliidiomarina halalkaliphila TaxID=2593535 RepID=A0A552X5D5_9GAMM|nr:hypothetical protein [Aliidiomarina halalkaliphila]TRW50215.1 hypothetical protein FM042_05100 [Aliidiomarina halalkaliphila]